MFARAIVKPLYFLGASAAVGLGMFLMGSESAPLWIPFVLGAFVIMYSIISFVDLMMVPTYLIPNTDYRKPIEDGISVARAKINILCALTLILSFLSGFAPVISWGVVTFEAISLASIILEGKVANDNTKEIHSRLSED